MGSVISNLHARVRLALQILTNVKTPPTGEIFLVADTYSGHLLQIDSTGNIIDLAAVDSQEDSVGFDAAVLWKFDSTTESWTVSNGTLALGNFVPIIGSSLQSPTNGGLGGAATTGANGANITPGASTTGGAGGGSIGTTGTGGPGGNILAVTNLINQNRSLIDGL